jgi:hypothetical protein
VKESPEARRERQALRLIPCTLTDAHAFVAEHHRHHRPAQGGLFAVACGDETVRGVAVIGRPVARNLQDSWTAEVVRLATDGTPNACSMLYGAAWRACRALGYRRLVTYILDTENGASLRASGFRELGVCGGGSWNREDRPRVDKHPKQLKIRFEKTL